MPNLNEEVTIEENEWVVEIKEQLEKKVTLSEMEHWEKLSIYKLPTCVTELNKKAYAPRAVSFGPYHHGDDCLKDMEEHKHRALLHFLEKSALPLENFMDSLALVAGQLKGSYHSLDPLWENDTAMFLQLMLLDGCFMIEVLRTCTENYQGYSEKDPIFSKHGRLHIIPYIRRDMLMLENQLPMLVLYTLLEVESSRFKRENHEIEVPKTKDEDVNKLVLDFCHYPRRNVKIGNVECSHVLEAYRKSLIISADGKSIKDSEHAGKPPGKNPTANANDLIVRSATELREAGIRFRVSRSGSLKDVSFHRGILTLPAMMVDDITETTFLNLIAFERFHAGVGNEVTSYIFLMDNIIDGERDVALLNSKRIIQNAIGSDKAVADMFNSLSKDATLEPGSSLEVVQSSVNDYCKKKYHKWRANLCHTYFRSPWALLSLIAAVFLFGFTITQTALSIIQFINDS